MNVTSAQRQKRKNFLEFTLEHELNWFPNLQMRHITIFHQNQNEQNFNSTFWTSGLNYLFLNVRLNRKINARKYALNSRGFASIVSPNKKKQMFARHWNLNFVWAGWISLPMKLKLQKRAGIKFQTFCIPIFPSRIFPCPASIDYCSSLIRSSSRSLHMLLIQLIVCLMKIKWFLTKPDYD